MIDGPQIILVHAGTQPTLDKIAEQVGGVGGFLGAVISTHFPEGDPGPFTASSGLPLLDRPGSYLCRGESPSPPFPERAPSRSGLGGAGPQESPA